MVQYTSQWHSQCLPFLSLEETERVLAAMESVQLQAGTTLYRCDEPADRFYVLVSGRIAVQKGTGFGERMQVVALLDPGAPIGESALVPGQFRGATLTAVQTSTLLALSAESFTALCAADAPLAVKLLTWVVGRMTQRLKKSSERLAHVL
jgi:CRP-like cAMP-binding protein